MFSSEIIATLHFWLTMIFGEIIGWDFRLMLNGLQQSLLYWSIYISQVDMQWISVDMFLHFIFYVSCHHCKCSYQISKSGGILAKWLCSSKYWLIPHFVQLLLSCSILSVFTNLFGSFINSKVYWLCLCLLTAN